MSRSVIITVDFRACRGSAIPRVIEIKSLVKHYGQLRAVDGIDFTVAKGEIFGILGPNGAGKTTTLEMVEGLREPDAGEIRINGTPVWPDPGRTKEMIGVQLQSTALFDYLTVREMIALFGSFYNKFLSRAEVDKLLDAVELMEKEKAVVQELSGGQQQRLSISLALVNDPDVVFLDEPTTGLDPQARRRLWEVVRQINAQGKTIVLTTHYMEEAEVLCGRVAIMDRGKIIAIDAPQRLIDGLGVETKVTFASAGAIPLERFRCALEGADIRVNDDGYIFYTHNVQSAVLGLFDVAQKEEISIENLNISGANLEDVFLHYTGKGLRD